MAIIKPGFTPGFRGRTQASSWNRRAHYLAREDGRESARLRDMAGRDIEPAQAIEALGGPRGAYHEIIVAPSDAECATIRARQSEDPDRATAVTGDRIAKAYAQGRPYVLAIHGQADRFHYHLAVVGPMSGQALGKHGQVQKAWSRELFGDEPRIQDWDAHLRFKKEKTRLQAILREQKENDLCRREALRLATPGQKTAAARPFEEKARDLIERRYAVEGRAILARYEARATLDSPRHRAELEQAEHRRTGALRRLEKRVTYRELREVLAGKTREAARRERAARGAAEAAARGALNIAMQELGINEPMRMAAQFTLVLGDEAVRASLKASMAAAKGAARACAQIAQANRERVLRLEASRSASEEGPEHTQQLSRPHAPEALTRALRFAGIVADGSRSPRTAEHEREATRTPTKNPTHGLEVDR